MRRSTAVIGLGVAIVLAGSAQAHHNMTAVFDLQDKVTLTGTLSKVDWRNPHIELIVDVTADGQKQAWSIEGPAPAFFRTRDPGRDEVVAAISQMVTAEVSRARDGSRLGLLRVMNLPGGKVLSACPQNC
jgi:Family of unknown function (DUF6152)